MSTGEFKREMGLVDGIAVVVGSMIGSGIFIVSAETSRLLGSPGWLLLSWIFAAALTITAAVCYSELSSMYPHAGGQYIFLRQAYGKLAGFLYGWTLFMVIQSGTIAAVAVAFAKFLGVFVPVISMKTILLQVGGWQFTALQLVALLVISVLTAINCQGIKAAKIIQTTFTTTKAVALALLIILGVLAVDRHAGAAVNFGANFWNAQDLNGNALSGLGLLSVLAVAMVGPLFANDAWNNLTFAGEEVKNSEKTVPRSLMIGTLVVGLLYTLTNVAYLLLLPMHGVKGDPTVIGRGIQFALEDRVGTAAAQIIFGQVGEFIMAAAIMISTFGGLNGLILAGPRAYYAMALDGLFFKKAGVLDPKTNVPTFGLILQGTWAAILTTTGTYGNLLDYVVFAALLFYVLTVIAIFVLRRKEPDIPRPFKVPLYPFLPTVYLVLAIAIMFGQICLSPKYSGFGLLIILSGLPVFFIWRAKASKGN